MTPSVHIETGSARVLEYRVSGCCVIETYDIRVLVSIPGEEPQFSRIVVFDWEEQALEVCRAIGSEKGEGGI
jgi:hypothetical protein